MMNIEVYPKPVEFGSWSFISNFTFEENKGSSFSFTNFPKYDEYCIILNLGAHTYADPTVELYVGDNKQVNVKYRRFSFHYDSSIYDSYSSDSDVINLANETDDPFHYELIINNIHPKKPFMGQGGDYNNLHLVGGGFKTSTSDSITKITINGNSSYPWYIGSSFTLLGRNVNA